MGEAIIVRIRNEFNINSTGVWFDNLSLSYTPIPEPSSALAGLLLAAGLLRRRRAYA